MSNVFVRLDRLGQVVVELSHAGRKERVDDRAREQAPQVRLEERVHLSFVGFPGKNKHKNQSEMVSSELTERFVRNKNVIERHDDLFSSQLVKSSNRPKFCF